MVFVSLFKVATKNNANSNGEIQTNSYKGFQYES